MRTTSAFTLIELLVIVAILAIVFALAIATWPRHDMALTQATNNLASSIRYARFEAVNRNTGTRVDLTQDVSRTSIQRR